MRRGCDVGVLNAGDFAIRQIIVEKNQVGKLSTNGLLIGCIEFNFFQDKWARKPIHGMESVKVG